MNPVTVFAGGVATFFATCVLFSILLPPVPTMFAILGLTAMTGIGIIVLISQRESRREDRLYRVPQRRSMPPAIDVDSWEGPPHVV